MRRYYFHVCDGQGFCEDPEGLELASNDAALEEAERKVRTLFEGVWLASSGPAAFIEVEDCEGRHLFTVTIDEVIAIRACGRREDKQLA